jgi:hypothetical protein
MFYNNAWCPGQHMATNNSGECIQTSFEALSALALGVPVLLLLLSSVACCALVTISSTYVYVYPCFPLHYSQRAVLVLSFPFASQGTGHCLWVQYNTALFGHLRLWASWLPDMACVFVMLFESALVYIVVPRLLSRRHGWLWIGRAWWLNNDELLSRARLVLVLLFCK